METAAVVALRRGSDAVLGCAFIGLLLIGIQTAVWGLMKQYGAKHDFPGYLLSFLPSIALWCAMGDQISDVFVYQPATHELILDSLLMTKDHYETYPVFSPDGKTLYFCSSTAEPIPSGYKDIKYNICKIGFDAATGKFGNQVDTIFNARELGKSATHPRPSYNGRYIMFTMSDGLYTRLYLACIDDKGNVSKPFLLPLRNPKKYYDELLDSYNTPDFTSKPVELDARAAGNEIMSDKRIPTKVR